MLETSVIAKKTAFKPADPPLMAADPKNVATAVALKELYCAPKREIDPETGEPIEPAEDLLNEFESEDIVGDATMYQAVGLGHQGQHRVNRRRVFEIQRDRAAPPIEQGGAAGTAQRVTTRPVDSNDLGAHVRQHHAAMGDRADADHFDDP